MERRFISMTEASVKLESRAEGEAPKIVGYASVFYDGTAGTEYRLYDDMVERIMPTAFDRAAKEDDVRGLYNHDANHLLGRTSTGTMSLSVDSKGLRYEIIPPDTQTARDMLALIKRGDLSGSSFSFTTDDQVWREVDGVMIREVNAVHLYDVGPVVFPAYTAATAGMRAVGEPKEAREAFEAWKAQRNSLAGKLASYRARAVEVE